MAHHQSILAGTVSLGLSLFIGLAALSLTGAAHAQLAIEEADGDGVLNPSDTSWRYYVDEMNRFPERLGIICVNGYWLDKTGDHSASLAFLRECARRGNPASMIYLAMQIEDGRGTKADPREATAWIRRSAETGYAMGQYHLGVALLLGRGVARDLAQARVWLAKAAAQGEADAAALIASNYDLQMAADPRKYAAR